MIEKELHEIIEELKREVERILGEVDNLPSLAEYRSIVWKEHKKIQSGRRRKSGDEN